MAEVHGNRTHLIECNYELYQMLICIEGFKVKVELKYS